MKTYRCIVVDPYDRTIYELESEGDFREIQRLISNDEGDEPCELFCTVNFGGNTTGYVDDNGNWQQFAWFALVGDVRLFCGRMVMQGSTYDGEVASLDADITSKAVADKVVWLNDEGAIEQAQRYTDAMTASARDSHIPVISLDTGLVERIEEAIENKAIKRRQQLESRSYRSQVGYPSPGDTEVGIFENGRAWRLLPKCLDKVNHSPDGFSWGYHGSGPAQLAFAILFDVTNDADKTQRFYQDYKSIVIAQLGDRPWELTAASVLSWLDGAESGLEKAAN